MSLYGEDSPQTNLLRITTCIYLTYASSDKGSRRGEALCAEPRPGMAGRRIANPEGGQAGIK